MAIKAHPTQVPESVEQTCLFRWAVYASAKYPELDLMYHIPNEGKRSQIGGAMLKAQGLKAGVPDVCLPVPRGKFHGLYIELKAGKNRATEKQLEWMDKLSAQGYITALCYGWESASETIRKYLEIPKVESPTVNTITAKTHNETEAQS